MSGAHVQHDRKVKTGGDLSSLLAPRAATVSPAEQPSTVVAQNTPKLVTPSKPPELKLPHAKTGEGDTMTFVRGLGDGLADTAKGVWQFASDNWWRTGALVAGGTALIVTSPAWLPPALVIGGGVLGVIGVGTGVYQAGNGWYDKNHAETPEQRSAAIRKIGAGTMVTALSALGAFASFRALKNMKDAGQLANLFRRAPQPTPTPSPVEPLAPTPVPAEAPARVPTSTAAPVEPTAPAATATPAEGTVVVPTGTPTSAPTSPTVPAAAPVEAPVPATGTPTDVVRRLTRAERRRLGKTSGKPAPAADVTTGAGDPAGEVSISGTPAPSVTPTPALSTPTASAAPGTTPAGVAATTTTTTPTPTASGSTPGSGGPAATGTASPTTGSATPTAAGGPPPSATPPTAAGGGAGITPPTPPAAATGGGGPTPPGTPAMMIPGGGMWGMLASLFGNGASWKTIGAVTVGGSVFALVEDLPETLQKWMDIKRDIRLKTLETSQKMAEVRLTTLDKQVMYGPFINAVRALERLSVASSKVSEVRGLIAQAKLNKQNIVEFNDETVEHADRGFFEDKLLDNFEPDWAPQVQIKSEKKSMSIDEAQKYITRKEQEVSAEMGLVNVNLSAAAQAAGKTVAEAGQILNGLTGGRLNNMLGRVADQLQQGVTQGLTLPAGGYAPILQAPGTTAPAPQQQPRLTREQIQRYGEKIIRED